MLTQNKHLSNKNIIDFKNSYYHTIARTTDGKVYCWGHNDWGLLGNGKNDGKICKPELNHYLRDKNIVDICCGARHSLVLTIDGQVYAWGYKYHGQIGNGRNIDVLIPYHVNGFNGEKVKMIRCGGWHSLALTVRGNVFSWGRNEFEQLGFEKLEFNSISMPKFIEINETFDKISCGNDHSLLLSCDGNIYVFGSNKFGELEDENIKKSIGVHLKLKSENKFIDITSHPHYEISMASPKEGTIFIWGQCERELIKSQTEKHFERFDVAFAHYYQITYETVIIDNKLNNERNISELTGSVIAVPPEPQESSSTISSESDVTDETKLFMYNKTKYKREFKELREIGSGSYGKVYETVNLFDEQNYAVKKLLLNELSDEIKKKSLDESKLIAKLQSDHVVQYKSSWIENNRILYIQMELCFSTLRDVLLKKRNEFQRQEMQPMSRLEYYISSELFKEILIAVNYLHKQTPPIIHRDLKPTNILITYGQNGRFVKLADFGLAVIHEFDEQTHTQGLGTVKYIAPEVLAGRNYDIKADIYSLGSVTQQVFDINIDSSSSNPISDPLLNGKYSKINEIVLAMMERRKIKRPDCDKILGETNIWALDFDELENDFSHLSTKQLIEESFHKFFIITKLKFKQWN